MESKSDDVKNLEERIKVLEKDQRKVKILENKFLELEVRNNTKENVKNS